MFNLFHTIRALRKLRLIRPDEAWLRTLRMRFVQEYSGYVPAPAAQLRPLKAGFAAVAVSCLIVVFAVGAAVQSANAAGPDDVLYPVKLFAERFESFFVVGNEGRIDFALKLAERRLDEVEKLGGVVIVRGAGTMTVATTSAETVITIGEGASSTPAPSTAGTLVAGTFFRAEGELEKAQALLADLVVGHADGGGRGEGDGGSHKTVKRLEKSVEKIEKLLERKNKISEKLRREIPKIARAVTDAAITATGTSVAVTHNAHGAITMTVTNTNGAGTSSAASTTTSVIILPPAPSSFVNASSTANASTTIGLDNDGQKKDGGDEDEDKREKEDSLGRGGESRGLEKIRERVAREIKKVRKLFAD